MSDLDAARMPGTLVASVFYGMLFKPLTASFGDAGDLVLPQLAQRMSDDVRDPFARLLETELFGARGKSCTDR